MRIHHNGIPTVTGEVLGHGQLSVSMGYPGYLLFYPSLCGETKEDVCLLSLGATLSHVPLVGCFQRAKVKVMVEVPNTLPHELLLKLLLSDVLVSTDSAFISNLY